MTTRPRLAVYRHLVLPPSETFVLNQLEAFDRFDVGLFGAERARSLVPSVPTFLLAESGPSPVALTRVRSFQLTRRSATLRRAVAAFRPDVLLAHFAQDGWRIAPTAAALHVPLVVACHGSDVLVDDAAARRGNPSMRQLAPHWPDLARAATAFLASSQYVADRLVLRGVPREKVQVRYLGTSIPPVSSVAQPRDGVLFVGRLLVNKGVDRLLRAFATVAHARPSARLTIAGDGPERAALEQLVATLGLGDTVRFTGVRTPEQVDELMREHAVLAVPSVRAPDGSSEGFGIVVIEAAARSLPVVAFDTGGIAEALGPEGERGGILVPADDLPALAAALDSVLDDPTVAGSLGARGRTYAERHFDLARCTHAIEEALLALVPRGAS